MALLGFQVPEEDDDVSEPIARYEATREAMLSRPAFSAEPPEPEPLPREIEPRGELHLERLRAAESGNGGSSHELTAGVVDLRRIVAFQKAVVLDSIEERIGDASQDDWGALADICLPEPSDGENLRGTYDKDGKGLTLTSPNPNLRISGIRQLGVGDDGGPIVGFHVQFGSPHLHVISYDGRCFLKDGYHRACGLLSRGITRAPCIFERAESFAAVHSGGTSVISPEYLLGTHPPLLPDFLDPAVSSTVEQQSFRKVVRVHAEDFVVHV